MLLNEKKHVNCWLISHQLNPALVMKREKDPLFPQKGFSLLFVKIVIVLLSLGIFLSCMGRHDYSDYTGIAAENGEEAPENRENVPTVDPHSKEADHGKKPAEEILCLRDDFIINIHEDITFKMVWIEGGSFLRGSEEGATDASPVHEVMVDDFWTGKYPVTIEVFQAFIEDSGYETEAEQRNSAWIHDGDVVQKSRRAYWKRPRFSQDSGHPVTSVSWNDALKFIDWLNQHVQKIEGIIFRLPTEAEWEYAARGGQKSQGYTYSGSCDIDSVAWYVENTGRMLRRQGTRPAGKKLPNELGLYDMSGNVWEWCQDYYNKAEWRGTWELDGGGALMNQGVHGIDLLQWIMGDIESVYARTDALARDIEVEDTAVINLKFANGAFGVIEGTTTVYPAQPTTLHIHGEKGSIILEEQTIKKFELIDKEVKKFTTG